MEDFWPNFDELSPDVNHSLDILRHHAETLPLKTNGKVKVAFSKMQRREVASSGNAFLNAFGNLASSNKTVEVLDNELQNKQDANAFFSNEEYKFDIYNDFYRFRVFVLKYNILYPISIDLDEDIAAELSKETPIQLSNDTELKELLKSVFNSKKIITIMIHIMAKNTSDII